MPRPDSRRAVNLSDLLREAAERDPDGVALIEHQPQRREMTWRELDEAAEQLARGLSGRGLVAGQRVALAMANRIDLPIAYFGILRGGMIAVPINPRSTVNEVGRMLTDSVSRVVLADAAGGPQVREAVAAFGPDDKRPDLVVHGTDPLDGETGFDAFLSEASGTASAAPADPESTAVILYTSGTSGRPRGAMLSHRALLANIEQVSELEYLPLKSDDIALGLLPLFHVYGLNAILGQAVRQGATVVMVDGFDPVGLLDLIQSEGITNVPVAPPVVAAWAGVPGLRERLAGVRTVLSGAANLDPDLAEAFTESSGHWVEQGYGLTEASPVVSATLASDRDNLSQPPKPGSVGRPLPGVELRIVDALGADAAPGDPGEIWLRGANVFSGYWPDGADGPDADGWYPSGDVGLLDADGDLSIVDRLRELVIVSGFNVYPTEVEDVIADVDGVEQVAVVGRPDEETGEAVIAFVEVAANSDEATVLEAVDAACRARLARFKQPSKIVVVSGLPRSATGKVEKGRLRAFARSSELGFSEE